MDCVYCNNFCFHIDVSIYSLCKWFCRYRKQKATEKYIGDLTEEQINLVDEIVKKGEVDNYYQIAPVFSHESAGITANESAKNREQSNFAKLSQQAVKKHESLKRLREHLTRYIRKV